MQADRDGHIALGEPEIGDEPKRGGDPFAKIGLIEQNAQEVVREL